MSETSGVLNESLAAMRAAAKRVAPNAAVAQRAPAVTAISLLEAARHKIEQAKRLIA